MLWLRRALPARSAGVSRQNAHRVTSSNSLVWFQLLIETLAPLRILLKRCLAAKRLEAVIDPNRSMSLTGESHLGSDRQFHGALPDLGASILPVGVRITSREVITWKSLPRAGRVSRIRGPGTLVCMTFMSS
ncbi:hypothetical protein MESS2_630002 [Mesorhizobium metallidurans STM 2683]|uniref:Uncharacterized protein n=1 Tax=Mesorhizobium metallidurans STM 2683 TaxID=1297569 RepID=M5ETY1_9HYPH|nr:hypothetical protein MESS2_630002 [Mesorhizobium metallidurans STM 2683]